MEYVYVYTNDESSIIFSDEEHSVKNMLEQFQKMTDVRRIIVYKNHKKIYRFLKMKKRIYVITYVDGLLEKFLYLNRDLELTKAHYYDVHHQVGADTFNYIGNNLHGFQKMIILNRCYTVSFNHGRIRKMYIHDDGELVQIEYPKVLVDIMRHLDNEIRFTLK